MLYYFLSNDNDNMYVDIKVEDHGIQNRILKEGLTIWISMSGKEEKKMGVRFPIGSQNQGTHRKTDHQENNSVPDGKPVNPIAMANTIEIIGFTSEQQRHFPSDNHDSFRGSVKYDEAGILYYKLVIPIIKLPLRNTRAGNGAMPFILGIEYGSLSVVNKQGENRGPAPSSIFHSRHQVQEYQNYSGLIMSDLQLQSSFHSFITANYNVICSGRKKLTQNKQ